MTLLIGFLLTLFIYSYLWRDNPLYRLAVHLLVGVSAGYATLIVGRHVLLPVYQGLATDPGGNSLWLIPILFALLLLLKLAPRFAPLGNSAIALLIAVGGAVALVGAIRGTLLPQIIGLPGGIAGFFSALLTIVTLFYFQFTRPANPNGSNSWEMLPRWQIVMRQLGQGIIMITLGAIFASTLSTSLILLTERLTYFVTNFGDLFNQLPF